MEIPISRIFAVLLLLAAPVMLPGADSRQTIADRTLIRELMDRYGIVHDSGTPEEYADLFSADGEIAVVAGGPAILSIARYTDQYAKQLPSRRATSGRRPAAWARGMPIESIH